ncbi:MAG: hypothetical protein Q4G41_05755, partial [Coriobacteriales bacterium]|nr:hypothetical protein [Coriobacteriales bacterium]
WWHGMKRAMHERVAVNDRNGARLLLFCHDEVLVSSAIRGFLSYRTGKTETHPAKGSANDGGILQK